LIVLHNVLPHLFGSLALIYDSSVLFREDEIRRIWARFHSLNPIDAKSARPKLPVTTVLAMPELANNPFKYRIIRYFSKSAKQMEFLIPPHVPSNQNDIPAQYYTSVIQRPEMLQRMYFEFDDFINMFSVFSSRAMLDTKSAAAFGIYDFTEDRAIDVVDIQCVIMTALGSSFSAQDTLHIARDIMQVADSDGNRQLDVLEFARILKRIPEFMANFQIDFDF